MLGSDGWVGRWCVAANDDGTCGVRWDVLNAAATSCGVWQCGGWASVSSTGFCRRDCCVWLHYIAAAPARAVRQSRARGVSHDILKTQKGDSDRLQFPRNVIVLADSSGSAAWITLSHCFFLKLTYQYLSRK